jgi:adenylosuccinate synthase
VKIAEVVIGANFGDEGKGLTTDYLAARAEGEAVVVRFNGGAQAGHTVMTPDGTRHVFSHFGSGSFAGAATFLSRFFVCNPLLFMKEYELLKKACPHPDLHADDRAPVTTPYDMMINQIAEESRGNGRHGSCGMGFGETIERHMSSAFPVSVADLKDTAALKVKLRHIREEWMPGRLEALGVTDIPQVWQERISSAGVLDKFLEDTGRFLQMVKPAGPTYLADTRQKVIFEGAQGLLLDQNRGWFPHVTRSHTGIRNVLALAQEAGIGALDVYYITRAYATRHGAGPLPHELGKQPYPRIEDRTNVTNAYQGSLRFGWLDADLLADSIEKDLVDNHSAIQLRHGLAVTCLDQLDGEASVSLDGKISILPAAALADALRKKTRASFLLESRGPTRATVTRS